MSTRSSSSSAKDDPQDAMVQFYFRLDAPVVEVEESDLSGADPATVQEPARAAVMKPDPDPVLQEALSVVVVALGSWGTLLRCSDARLTPPTIKSSRGILLRVSPWKGVGMTQPAPVTEFDGDASARK
jgi:hypothetical protein